MKQLFEKVFKSKFIKNVTIMATGAAGAQIIALLTLPIITRLYGPEAYGILGTFNSFVNIIVPIAALTYPIAIVLPKSQVEALGIIRLSTFVTSGFAILVFFIVILFKDLLISLLNIEAYSYILYFIPLVILFSGLMEIMEQWLIRTKQFVINAKVTFYQSIYRYGSQVIIGLFFPLALVLVFISATSNGFKAILMYYLSNRKELTFNKRQHSKKKLVEIAKKYKDFPVYRFPEALLNSLTGGLPVLMLTSFFGPASAGFYTLGRTVLRAPSHLIGKAVGDVFYPKITEAANKGKRTDKILINTTIGLATVGFIPFGTIILFGPELFSFIFGDSWKTAGQYAKWVSLLSFSGFLVRPSVRSLPVFNAQKLHLLHTVITLLVSITALSLGFYVFENDIVAVSMFCISKSALDFCLIVITVFIAKTRKISIRN